MTPEEEEFWRIQQKIHGPLWKQRQKLDGMHAIRAFCFECYGTTIPTDKPKKPPRECVFDVDFIFDVAKEEQGPRCPECGSNKLSFEMMPSKEEA